MSYGNKLSITRRERIPQGIKAERTHHVITHNPEMITGGNKLLVKLPKLEANIIIVPGTLKLVFELNLTGDEDSWFVNNISANLIDRLVITWGRKILLNINNYYIYQTYKDLWLTRNQRINMIRNGVSTLDIRQARAKASSAKSHDMHDRINKIYGNRYEILLDCTFLTDQHPFYPYIYTEGIQIELYLNKPELVINSTDPTAKTNYNLTDITFEYETIYEPQLCRTIEQLSDSTVGISYLYDYISYIGMNPINKSDQSFMLNIHDPRISMKGILMLFEIPPTAGARDSEYFYNPEITNIDITIGGISNKIFAQGYKEDKHWFEAKKLFMKEDQKINDISNMDLLTYYGTPSESKYCLWIDTRSTEDNKLHGSGLKCINTYMAIKFTKNNTGSGPINVHTYLIADAQFTLINRLVTDPIF